MYLKNNNSNCIGLLGILLACTIIGAHTDECNTRIPVTLTHSEKNIQLLCIKARFIKKKKKITYSIVYHFLLSIISVFSVKEDQLVGSYTHFHSQDFTAPQLSCFLRSLLSHWKPSEYWINQFPQSPCPKLSPPLHQPSPLPTHIAHKTPACSPYFSLKQW